jgi:hypothetical protein
VLLDVLKAAFYSTLSRIVTNSNFSLDKTFIYFSARWPACESGLYSISDGRIYQDPKKPDHKEEQEENLPLRAFKVPRHSKRRQKTMVFVDDERMNPIGIRKTYGNGIRRTVSTAAIPSSNFVFPPPPQPIMSRLTNQDSEDDGGYLAMDSPPREDNSSPRSENAALYNIVELSATNNGLQTRSPNNERHSAQSSESDSSLHHAVDLAAIRDKVDNYHHESPHSSSSSAGRSRTCTVSHYDSVELSTLSENRPASVFNPFRHESRDLTAESTQNTIQCYDGLPITRHTSFVTFGHPMPIDPVYDTLPMPMPIDAFYDTLPMPMPMPIDAFYDTLPMPMPIASGPMSSPQAPDSTGSSNPFYDTLNKTHEYDEEECYFSVKSNSDIDHYSRLEGEDEDNNEPVYASISKEPLREEIRQI